MVVSSIGDSMKCIGIPKPANTMYYSVDKKSYHRGVTTFEMYMSGLDYRKKKQFILIDDLSGVI